jgi:Zn-dependent protease/predicted transcriptional regulator
MFNDSITLGRLFGIRVAVSFSWFGILILLTVSLGGFYFAIEHPQWPRALHWGLGVVASLLFFSCVLLHELAHALVALRNDVPVKSITLFLLGGVTHFGRVVPSPSVEFAIALAGPLASLGLALVAGALYLLVQGFSEPLGVVLLWLAITNLALGIFNLVPGFPLDGGRLLRAMAWFAAEDFRWATQVATRGGQLAAVTMMLGGGYLAFGQQPGAVANGIWLVFMGWFLLSAANGSYHATVALHALDGFLIRDVMRRSVLKMDATAPLSDLAEVFRDNPDRDDVIVVRDGTPVGLIGQSALGEVSPDRVAVATIADRMRQLSPASILVEDLPAGQALQALLESGNAVLPVVTDGEVVGLIRRDDLLRVIELRRRLGR